jgi:hypothetical protein
MAMILLIVPFAPAPPGALVRAVVSWAVVTLDGASVFSRRVPARVATRKGKRRV